MNLRNQTPGVQNIKFYLIKYKAWEKKIYCKSLRKAISEEKTEPPLPLAEQCSSCMIIHKWQGEGRGNDGMRRQKPKPSSMYKPIVTVDWRYKSIHMALYEGHQNWTHWEEILRFFRRQLKLLWSLHLFSGLIFILFFPYKEAVSKCRYINRNERAVVLSNILTNTYTASHKLCSFLRNKSDHKVSFSV